MEEEKLEELPLPGDDVEETKQDVTIALDLNHEVENILKDVP